MIEEKSYQKKFELLQPWLIQILHAVKKELKNDHLKKDSRLIQKYFTKKSIDKLTQEEILEAYSQELKEGNEEIGEWISSRWVFKHAEIYQFFAVRLAEINPQFDQIEEISPDHAESLKERAIAEFGATPVYIFSVLNSVAFPPSIYQQLRERAENERVDKGEQERKEEETLETLKARQAKEIAKLTEKYENRLLGCQKKYIQDVEGLKKQIKQLQRKLQ